jgi:hypothetical protein
MRNAYRTLFRKPGGKRFSNLGIIVEEDEMGRSCSTNGGEEERV